MTPDNPRYGDVKDRPECWYASQDVPSLAQLHAAFERVVAKHQSTTFVAAHFGCYVEDLDRWFRAYPNYHVDTAAAIGDMGRGDVSPVRELFDSWPERILFGTDLSRTPRFEYPNQGARRWDLHEYFNRHWRFLETADTDLQHPIPEQVPWRVSGLDLPTDVLHALYHDNAARLYRIPTLAD